MTTSVEAKPSFEQAYGQRLPLLRLAVLLLGSREQAEDVVQSVFAAAYPRWTAIEQPLSYLRRAVINSVAEHQRRQVRSRRYPVTAEPTTSIPDVDETWALLVRLPARQRIVVVLHFYEDLALVDIADVLGRPAATIRSDLRRALSTLQKELT